MTPAKSRPVIVLEPTDLVLPPVLGAGYEVRTGYGWGDVDALLSTASPATVLVVDPYAEARAAETFPRLRALLRRFPSVPVVAALRLDPANARDLGMLLEWGVSEVVSVEDETTPAAVRARLRQAHARPFKRRLEQAMSRWVPPEARLVLMGAAEVAVEGGGAVELAGRLGIAPRTLAERCERLDLPSPRQIQSWMRILLACALLDDPGRTAYSAAFACGYATDRSLRRAVRSLLATGVTPLRETGAFPTAAAGFDAYLGRLRERGQERRRRKQAPRGGA